MQALKPTIFFDSASIGSLRRSVRESSIGQLRLSTRAHNSLEALGVTSIGDLVDMARGGIPSPRAAGRITAANIAGALHALARSIMPDGAVDWVRYAAECELNSQQRDALLLKMKPVHPRCLHISSPLLDGLNAAVRSRSNKILHLRARALHSLERAGIRSVGELIDAARHGIGNLHAAGPQTRSELRDVLNALAKAAHAKGDVDMVQYAIHRNFRILPGKDCADPAPCDFAKVFSSNLKVAVQLRFGESGRSLFEQYFFRNDSEASSLRGIAQSLGLTHQAIGQRKDGILKMLRGAFLEDDYTGCCFRFHNALVNPLRRLRTRLNSRSSDAFRDSGWKQALSEIWAIDSAELGALEHLFQEILGFEVVHRSGRRFEPIILPKSRGTSAFTSAQKKIEGLLRIQFPRGLSDAEILEQLRRFGQTDLAPEEIRTLIQSIPGIEYAAGEKRFRLRVARLVRLSDQLERILAEKSSPMRRRELAMEVNRFKGKGGSIRSDLRVGSAMSGDKRFKPIGRSGAWGLARWNIETGTIAEVVASCLEKSGESLTKAELYALVAARRPVKMSSIKSVLQTDGRFRLIPPRTWQLSKNEII